MKLRTRVRGDVGDTINVVAEGVDNLTNVTVVEAHVWHGATAATLTATVTNAAARTVAVSVDPWLATAAAKEWNFELEFTFASGDVITWPSDTPAKLPVRAEGA